MLGSGIRNPIGKSIAYSYSLIVFFFPLSAVKLSLNDCDFSGPLPSELGYLWNMTRLQLKNNAFTGTIPKQYGRLDQLEQWTLEGNRLEGEVPLAVCDLLTEKLGQFIVDCEFVEKEKEKNRNKIYGFDCEPECCTLCRDVSN